MANYVIFDADGSVVNVVALDAGSLWMPPAGQTMLLEVAYLVSRGEDASKIAAGQVKEQSVGDV